MRILLLSACAALALGTAACGDDSSDDGTEALATTAPSAAETTAEATEGGPPPDELVGTYETTLEASDVPADAPPELKDGGPAWKLRIGASGGPEDGPFLAIDSADEDFGNLEAPSLHVDGDRLLLVKEECATGGEYQFHDNEYRWKLDGETLTITEVENRCPDEVALTILTSRPWKKVD